MIGLSGTALLNDYSYLLTGNVVDARTAAYTVSLDYSFRPARWMTVEGGSLLEMTRGSVEGRATASVNDWEHRMQLNFPGQEVDGFPAQRIVPQQRELNMTFDLHKWTSVDRKALMTLCNAVDRTFLSDRLPYPYTEADADWWLGMVAENDGKEGIWRAIVVNEQIVGSISVERMADDQHNVGAIGLYDPDSVLDAGDWYGGSKTDLRDCISGIGI